MPITKELKLLPLNIQFFADGEGGESGSGQGDGEGHGSGSQGQETFSKEYVQDLRNEAANYRTKLRDLEGKTEAEKKDAVKSTLSALGLDYDDNKSLDDNVSRVSDFKNSAEKRANDRLIQAEATLLASDPEIGINPKAIGDVLSLMDKTNIKVKEDGSVEGLKEAISEFVKERPYYQTEKKNNKAGSDFNGGSPTSQSMNDLIRKQAGR